MLLIVDCRMPRIHYIIWWRANSRSHRAVEIYINVRSGV